MDGGGHGLNTTSTSAPTGARSYSGTSRFRDYLRDHPDSAAEYEALKRDLAHRYPNDIDSYVSGKSAFVEAILAVDGGEARS